MYEYSHSRKSCFDHKFLRCSGCALNISLRNNSCVNETNGILSWGLVWPDAFLCLGIQVSVSLELSQVTPLSRISRCLFKWKLYLQNNFWKAQGGHYFKTKSIAQHLYSLHSKKLFIVESPGLWLIIGNSYSKDLAKHVH